MTLILNLPPELERYLTQIALQQGLPVEVMALHLLSASLTPEQKQQLVIATLQSWVTDGDEENHHNLGQDLTQGLDRERLSERSLFPVAMQGITW